MKQTSDTAKSLCLTPANSPVPDASGNWLSPFASIRLLLPLAGLFALVGLAFLSFTAFRADRELVQAPVLSSVDVASGDELVSLLKEEGLWEITGNFAVPRLILSSYPANIGKLPPEAKKRAFLNALLPTALMAMDEVEKERLALSAVLAKIPGGQREVLLSEPLDRWAGTLSRDEIDVLMVLGFKYRTERIGELVKRVDVVPLSLLLAQAALESSWGGSRIAREGNNLFGVVTWGANAVEPVVNADGSGQRYANYDSILESVRAYIIMLNRLPSYEHFREIRSRSQNPLEMVEGLRNYSERREAYIADLKVVMIGNDLDRYDGYSLVLPPLTRSRNHDLWALLAQPFNRASRLTAI